MNAPEGSLWAQKPPILGNRLKHNNISEESVATNAKLVVNNQKKPI